MWCWRSANFRTITVNGEEPPLNAADSSSGASYPRATIVDVPNNGRNIFQLVWSAPGVTKTSTYWGSMENYAVGNATNAQINGGARRENETLLDGITAPRSP